MNEKNKNDKDEKIKIIGLLIIFIMCVAFSAGYILGSRNGEMTKFTEEEIEAIIKFQSTYEDDVIVYRGENGEILIGLDD